MQEAIHRRYGSMLLIVVTINTITVSALAQVPPDTAWCGDAYITPTMRAVPTLLDDLSSLLKQVNYPEVAAAVKLEGRIAVAFINDRDGRSTSFETRPLNLHCGAPPVVPVDSIAAVEALLREAVRIAKRVRFRQVVQCNGKIEEIRMTLPVLFRLPEE